MRGVTFERVGLWTQGAALVALATLAWVILVPGGVFWPAIAVAGLLGATVATHALLRRRSVPTLSQLIADAMHEPRRFPPRFRTILHPSGRPRT